jgi:hypothetical protein
MSGGTSEIHRDSEPLISGTHDRAASSVLHDKKKSFTAVGVKVGLAIENETTGSLGLVTAVTDHEITSSGGFDLELVTNGGFELGAGNTFTGWSKTESGNDTVIETTTANSGSRAVKITYVDGLAETLIYYFGAEGYNLDLTPGDTVNFEFYTRGDGLVSGFYSIYDRSNSADIVVKTSTAISAATYAKVSGSFVVPAGCTLGRVFFYAPTSAGSVYYDDVSFSAEGSATGVTWSYGDTYSIYKTATKGSLISTQWTDLSRGWKTPMDELEDGWRPEDVDINRDGEREVWGPEQPENYRR